MRLHRFGEGAEDHAGRGQLVLERGGHRYAVEHRVDRDASQARAFMQGHAELLVGGKQLRVDIRQALRTVGVHLRRRVVGDGLVVDGRDSAAWPSAAPSW